MPYGDEPLTSFLTVAGWKKHKTVIAKIVVKKTKMSEALKAVEDAYAPILKAKVAAQTPKTCPDAVTQLEGIEVRLKQLPALPKVLSAVEKLAKQVALDFKLNNLVPKSATQYVTQIEKYAAFENKAVKGAIASYQTWAKNLQAIIGPFEKLYSGDMVLNLDACLSTAKVLEAMKKFLASEYSSENLDFILAVKSNPKAVAARKIYLQYIDVKAKDQINLPAAVRSYYDKLDAAGAWTSPDWKKAVDEVRKLIIRDSGKRFLASAFLYDAL